MSEVRQNCIDAGPGKGFCDRCAAGWYDLCRYVLTVKQSDAIDKLLEAKALNSHAALEQACDACEKYGLNHRLAVHVQYQVRRLASQDLPESFDQAWARMAARGYKYGEDALTNVRFGFDLARGSLQ